MNKPLYDSDFFAWTQEQADAMRRRSVNELDWDNLVEEVESLGKQEQGELRNHFIILLQHLLKWRVQPARRTRSWSLTVVEQRRQIERLLKNNPSLRPQAECLLAEAYEVAVVRAARETRSPLESFPAASPYSLADALSGTLDD